jgi:hypothetical protein
MKLDFTASRLPDIQVESETRLNSNYLPSEWIRYNEANGTVSMLNIGQISTIICDSRDEECLALIRFYAVDKGSPYEVRFIADGAVLDAHLICQSESRLARFILPRRSGKITMELRILEGPAVDFYATIHLGTAKLVPINSAAGELA